MKTLFKLLIASMALGLSLARADQFALPYGWTGGNGILGQCLISNAPALPSFQACPGGGGAVTSVGLSLPSVFTISNSPVTSTGTLTAVFATGQTANLFLATPSGSTGAVALRAITTTDLAGLGPSLGDTAVSNLNVTGTNLPTTGLSKSGGGSLLLNAAGATGASISSGSSKTLGTNFGVVSTGTKFTASGCSNSTTVGGSTAGTYVSGTTGTCTVTITLPTATNGWRCTANDMTTPADVQNQTASTTTSCTIAGTTVTSDVIIFSAMGF